MEQSLLEAGCYLLFLKLRQWQSMLIQPYDITLFFSCCGFRIPTFTTTCIRDFLISHQYCIADYIMSHNAMIVITGVSLSDT